MKRNERNMVNEFVDSAGIKMDSEGRSFLCLDTKERTKGKIKAGEKTAVNFLAERKQIKHAGSPEFGGDEYLFPGVRLENCLYAAFSQANVADASQPSMAGVNLIATASAFMNISILK